MILETTRDGKTVERLASNLKIEMSLIPSIEWG
jgi:hypothetical protein